MLVSETLFGIRDKVQEAIDLLRKHEPPEGYYLSFSGGKDSVVVLDLAKKAGVQFDAHYNITTVDPPELVKFIKAEHPQVIRHIPTLTMWELIIKKRMPPTRLVRYCCEVLKEHGGNGRLVILGLRKDESNARVRWGQIGENYKTHKKIINPIYYWSEIEVWDFIDSERLKYCSLYDDPGYSRLGCLMCPMATRRKRIYDGEKYPKFYQAYLRAFDRMLVGRMERGLPTKWQSGQEVMDWWLSQ